MTTTCFEMASVIDQRSILVERNVPKLIQSLTGFSKTDENYRACVNFAFSHFKHHRYLTVNSHEIKRDIDGICEKFRFSNLHEIEKKFRKMVESCVTDELAVHHYEKDAMYAIMNLLTTLSYDPINTLQNKLRDNKEVVTFKPVPKQSTKASDIFISSLLKDNFKLQRNETDSELSDWTDSDEEDGERSSQGDPVEAKSLIAKKTLSNTLKPPEKPEVYKTLKLVDSENWLLKNIQHSWWTEEIVSTDVTSSHPVANFCDHWQKHLSNKSMGFIKPRPLSKISEYCLLREIFWMFTNPVDCKFFKVNESEISLRTDVTLPSTMPESLHIFLQKILRPINLMHYLRTDCLKSQQSSTLTHTMESYFNIVQNILDKIIEFILEEEETVKEQKETYTIVILYNKLQPHAKMLEMLWHIHSTSIINEANHLPHICAAYLLAGLSFHVQTSCQKEKKNLAIVLLMSCLRTYLEIFEIWWTEARLDDLKSEFLMHKTECEETIQPRLLVKSKEKSFYLNDETSKRITEDPIIAILLKYSIKASFTLDVISKLDRVHEMRQIVNDSTPLYDEFVAKIRQEIRKFSQSNHDKESTNTNGNVQKKVEGLMNQKLVEEKKNGMLENGDHLLLLAFESTFERLADTLGAESEANQLEHVNQIELYDTLNSSSDYLLLPLEHSIHHTINNLLDKKISIAERFVMNIYKVELHIEHHLKEIRKVFFLESNELSNFFYLKLFPQMEAGEMTWANAYLLSVALNDAICSSRQNSATLYSVEVNRKLGHRSVLESIDNLTLCFNVNKNLLNIFHPESMKKYNEVFRLLLKIKWGQRILACLKFPNFFKHRTPYARMQMIDLVIKRLSLTRFAMQHSINSLHNHLMAMLHSSSLQLDSKVSKATNISELISHHENFVDSFHEQSFLGSESENILGIIMEMLKIAKVLKDEWVNVTAFAALDEKGNVDTISLADLNDNSIEIDKAFSVCEYQLKILLDN